MRDLVILLVFVMYLCVGLVVPFVGALGYIWVDTFYPQAVSYGLLSYVPVSMIVAVVAICSYLLFDRRSAPRPGLHVILTVLMFAWVTASLNWSAVPDSAWGKWNWAGKTVAFSAFIPYFFRSRLQIEAFVLTWTFSAIIHIMPVGIKTIATGGGYGQELGVVSGNSLLSEGSTLATVCAAFVPLLLWGRRHSTMVPERLRTPGFLGYAALSGAAAIGTFARTTLLAFGVMAVGTLLRSSRKVPGIILLGLMIGGGALITGQKWEERMHTTATYGDDSSALTRLEMWQWTFNYVKDHPFGGGFDVYKTSRIETPINENGEVVVQIGRAYHNSFFEMLGEQGWVGLFLFLTLCLRTLRSMQAVRRRTSGFEEFAWIRDLASAVQIALLSVMTGGCFVGIAFQPMFWYVFALGESVHQYMRRAEHGGVPAPVSASRPMMGLSLAGDRGPAPLA